MRIKWKYFKILDIKKLSRGLRMSYYFDFMEMKTDAYKK